jgi:hypothetical protein
LRAEAALSRPVLLSFHGKKLESVVLEKVLQQESHVGRLISSAGLHHVIKEKSKGGEKKNITGPKWQSK